MEKFLNSILPIQNKPGIYAFLNIIDGKVYVGQSKDVRKRKSQHEGKTSSNSRKFHNALKFHGVDSFEFFVLEYCDTSILDEREVYWISKINSLHPNGYNLKSGGGALHEHHPETKEIMSLNQKARVSAGKHLFSSLEFQNNQTKRQRDLVRKGLHTSQDPDVKAKRMRTVQSIIERDGKLFTYKPEAIVKKRLEQNLLYEAGLGKFQQLELIEANKLRVQDQLAAGNHFSQKEGWSNKMRLLAKAQMKSVCIGVRRPDGTTTIHCYESFHAAQAAISVDRSALSAMCKTVTFSKSLTCDFGLIIIACIGEVPTWDIKTLENLPTSYFLKSMPVNVTIETSNGVIIQRQFISQHAACNELEAHHRAFRWIIKGEKYKSTKCNLGRIVKIVEVEPDFELFNAMINIKSRKIKNFDAS